MTTRLAAALADCYRIERELGQGGMATVHLAEDLKHKRQVAIKVLKPELAAVIGAERFLTEIRTTANLQHPHILPLHDSGSMDGTVFYVMPFIAGESLRDRLARERQLPVADAVRIASQVSSALDYAHRQGVIHRDIKPENILLHDGSALVADFGIALAASQSDGGSRMTETGMSLGTPSSRPRSECAVGQPLSTAEGTAVVRRPAYEVLRQVWRCNHKSKVRIERVGAAPAGNCDSRVVRGGSRWHGLDKVRAASREGFARRSRANQVGFRVARTLT